jgi:hypothetical protein
MSQLALPAHAWRVLHSGFVDEVLKSEPEVCLAVNDRLCGLGWESFTIALHHKTLRMRVVPITRDGAWVMVDYCDELGAYRPVLMMRAPLLGVDPHAVAGEREDSPLDRGKPEHRASASMTPQSFLPSVR